MPLSKKQMFMNGFVFLKKVYEKRLGLQIDFFFPKPQSFDMITNFFAVNKLGRRGKLQKYKIVHINNWENFYNIKYKKKNQLWIAESHGIHLGLHNKIAINQSKGLKKLLSFAFSGIISSSLRKSIKKFDVYVVSIPNALPFAKKIRKDAIWIPNPVNELFFKNTAKKKLEGDPAVFMPSRMHPVKNPLFAIHLFKKIISKYPSAKLHLINYPVRFGNPKKYEKHIQALKEHIIFHNHIKKEELPSYYAGADIVLGAFSKDDFYANLNLIELEAMASGAAVVARDMHEFLKKDFAELEKLTFKLLEDRSYRKEYIQKTKAYVKKMHSEESVAKQYKKIIQDVI